MRVTDSMEMIASFIGAGIISGCVAAGAMQLDDLDVDSLVAGLDDLTAG